MVIIEGSKGFDSTIDIQRDGKLVIPAGCDRVQAFSESYAAVKIDEKWGFIVGAAYR